VQIEEGEAAALAHMGVQAMGDVDEDDMEHLCAVSGILPLPSLADLDAAGGGHVRGHVGFANGTQRSMVGGRSMMHFDICDTASSRTHRDGAEGGREDARGGEGSRGPRPHTVMLRAPDKGAGRLLLDCLQRAFW